MNSDKIVEMLREERGRIDAALAALRGVPDLRLGSGVVHRGPGRPAKKMTPEPMAQEVSAVPKRKLSAKVRRRMAAAQQARWAKIRGEKAELGE